MVAVWWGICLPGCRRVPLAAATHARAHAHMPHTRRVLLERLVVNRPHPYGLLVTFIELIRNPKYAFWDKTDFIRGVPELEKLFSSVAKSINTQMQSVIVSGNKA